MSVQKEQLLARKHLLKFQILIIKTNILTS